MKRKLLAVVLLSLLAFTIQAQTVVPLKGNDCNGIYHDLIGDLDAGKAVLLHFFMPNCGSCPPPAQEIEAMAKRILVNYPDRVTGYALPFNNTTNCAATASWVTTSGLSLFAPYDSGAMQVANYGGFGMPTVVLLGGKDHRVMFVTLSYASSDTTIMRDSILNLMQTTTGINELPDHIASFTAYPSPASHQLNITLNVKQTSEVTLEMMDISGKRVALIMNEKCSGTVNKTINVSDIPPGNYILRMSVNGQVSGKKVVIGQ